VAVVFVGGLAGERGQHPGPCRGVLGPGAFQRPQGLRLDGGGQGSGSGSIEVIQGTVEHSQRLGHAGRLAQIVAHAAHLPA